MPQIVISDTDMLGYAIQDGINRYVRDVLVRRGFVDGDRYFGDQELLAVKYEIARLTARLWGVCELPDEPGEAPKPRGES